MDRTQGISSSEIRSEKSAISLGLIGEGSFINKVALEASYVNGIKVSGIYASDDSNIKETLTYVSACKSLDELLECSDAVYIRSCPSLHYEQVKYALEKGKHVLCESPIALSQKECKELFQLAKKKKRILFEGIKTAYSTAYYRLILLAKTGKIGNIVSVDATCTSLEKNNSNMKIEWNSMCEWGPTALLPVFQILGTDYATVQIATKMLDEKKKFDVFTKISFNYSNAVASIKVGRGVKSEGELIISGTKGYIYVPAPWWKTDYFEARYENPIDNKRYFYKLEGEGIRYELADFVKSVEKNRQSFYVSQNVSVEVATIMEKFYLGENLILI